MSVARSAIVTGGGDGIGLALARVLAEEGYGLTLSGRDETKLASAVESLAGIAPRVQSFAGDQANPATHDELVAQHAAAFGDLDVLVCNAGTTRRSMLAENRPRDLERLFAVNVSAPFLLVRAALPLLRHAARARGSALVALTSSIAAQRAVSGYSLYSATKSALSSLARSINEEEAPASGVRACAIEPGFVDTPMTEVLRDELGADAMLSPSDVAEVLRMLLRLSPAAVVGEVVIARRTAPHLAP